MAPTKKRVAKAKGYQRPDTDGKLFRVRDKDYMDGSEVTIWGENLTYESAHALKERVCGSGRSRSARVEEMSIPLPSADPTLESVRQKGLSAARVAATTAGQRAARIARKSQEAYASSAPRPRAMPKPVAMALDPDLEVPDVDEDVMLDGDAEDSEVKESEASIDDEVSEYEQKGKELYEAYMMTRGGVSATSWDKLAPKDKAAFSFEAASSQGPHVDAVKVATAGSPANGAAGASS